MDAHLAKPIDVGKMVEAIAALVKIGVREIKKDIAGRYKTVWRYPFLVT